MFVHELLFVKHKFISCYGCSKCVRTKMTIECYLKAFYCANKEEKGEKKEFGF